MLTEDKIDTTLYLIYDGECILCRHTAKAVRLKKAVGELQLLDARKPSPLVLQLAKSGYDLNKGVIVKYHEQIYFGADALHFLALLSSPVGLLNRMNAYCFRSKLCTRLAYPLLKMVRNSLLWLRGIPKLGQRKPDRAGFGMVFEEGWDTMPLLLKKRYGDKLELGESIMLKGVMNIYLSMLFRCFSPIMRVLGVLVPYNERQVPVTVTIQKMVDETLEMHRTFYYSKKSPYHFRSQLKPIGANQIVELMRSKIGVRLRVSCTRNKVTMQHEGYVWHVFRKYFPLPAGILFGRSHAKEEVLSETRFKMSVCLKHPLFGTLFQYEGTFDWVTE